MPVIKHLRKGDAKSLKLQPHTGFEFGDDLTGHTEIHVRTDPTVPFYIRIWSTRLGEGAPYIDLEDWTSFDRIIDVPDNKKILIENNKDQDTTLLISVNTGLPTPNEPPVADFSWSPYAPKPGETVQVTNNSHDPDGRIVRYRWGWGDGTTDAGYEPSHSWDEPDDYYVELRVKDNSGAVDTERNIITVGKEANQPPYADFAVSPRQASPYTDIQFNSKSYDRDGSIRRYSWDFGDGNTSTAKSPTHSYEDEGTFNVSLTVTDNDGATDTLTKNVTISAETEVNPPDGGKNTGGGKTSGTTRITTETEENGSWKGLDNLVPNIEIIKIEHFSLGWSCPIGIGPFSIDVCAIVAAPIEVVVNIILDLIDFIVDDLLEAVAGWVIGLLRDTVDSMLTFPPPLEQLSDYAVDWIIYGEDAARTNLTNEIKGVVTDWTKEYVKGVLPSEQDIENYVIGELDDFAKDMGINPDAKRNSLTNLINNEIDELNLDPDTLADKTLDQLLAEHPELTRLFAPERIREASFIYRITKDWYKEHGYDPEGKPLEVHVTADLYSNFFNAVAWTPVDQLPDKYTDWQFEPYKNRDLIYSALGIDIDQFDLTEYEEELFMRRSFRDLQATASNMQDMVVGWLESSVEEFQPTWQEIVTELSDLLEPPVKEILKDEGFIVPANVKEQWATVPEALDALQTISTFLDNIDAVTPDELESLDDETQALIDELKKLQGESKKGS